MIDRLRAIAANTFKEAVRDRILVMFLVFAIVLMASSTVLSWLTVGSELKVVSDLGLAALSIFGNLMAVFIGITLVHKEVEKKTIYAVLAKPVARWQFLLGKYLGLMLTLAAVTGLMAVFYLGMVWIKGGVAPTHLLPAIVLAYLELSIITAVAIVFSSLTTPILAAVFTAAIWVVGHLSGSLVGFLDYVPSPLARVLVNTLYYGLPDLETFNVRSQVVYEMRVGAEYLLDAAAYAGAYTAGMLTLAILLFRRKDLT